MVSSTGAWDEARALKVRLVGGGDRFTGHGFASRQFVADVRTEVVPGQWVHYPQRVDVNGMRLRSETTVGKFFID